MTPQMPDRPRNENPVLVISRIHLPEAAAASFRLDAVERALVRAGLAVRVLTTSVPGLQAVDPEGVSVSRWPALRDSSGYLRGYLPYMSFDIPLVGRLLFTRTASIALVEPPPTTGVIARLILGLRRTPYVWYAPDVWSDATDSTSAPGVVKAAVRAMESFAIRGARAVVAVNEGVAERVRLLGARTIHVVPNGIDTEVFVPVGLRPTETELAEVGITGPYLLYAGTASEWQGAEVFVRALARVRRLYPEVQLLFIGQGTAWPRLAELAERIEPGADGAPAVLFKPSMPAVQAAAWQRGALASLVSIRPGIGYDFAYPTKVLASVACGTPVLYAGAGPARADIESAHLGWCCEHDEDSVAATMGKAVEAGERDDTERNRLHSWVLENRSIRATGEAVARILAQLSAR